MRTARATRRNLMLGAAPALLVGLLPRVSMGAEAASEMTIEQTRQAMEAYAGALLGGGPYEIYFAEGVVVTLVGSGLEVKGPAAAKTAIDALHHEQFNAKPEIKNLVIGPGQAALEADFIGTQIGEFAGIPASGKKVDVPYSVFYELKDSKITALRIYGLVDGLVQQLSAVQKK